MREALRWINRIFQGAFMVAVLLAFGAAVVFVVLRQVTC
jgi:hypothetical protein